MVQRALVTLPLVCATLLLACQASPGMKPSAVSADAVKAGKGGKLIGQDGNNVVSDRGAALIGMDGATLRTVVGSVKAPLSLKASGGVTLISDRGLGIISDRGSNLVSDRTSGLVAHVPRLVGTRDLSRPSDAARAGALRHVLQQAAPLAEGLAVGARVYLADAAGQRILGLPEGRTDANGQFQIANVPRDYTFVVVAEVPTEAGRTAKLQTIVRPAALPSAVTLEAASTLVAAGVLKGLVGQDMGQFNPASFQTVVEATRRNLTPQELPDLTDRLAVERQMSALAARIEGLEASLEAMRKDLRAVEKSLEELKRELATRPSGEATPLTGTPASDLPATPTARPSAAQTVAPTQVATATPSPSAQPTPTPTPAPGSAETWQVTTVAGVGQQGAAAGSLASAWFNQPQGVDLDANGRIFVQETMRVWLLDADKASVYASTDFPFTGLALNGSGALYLSMSQGVWLAGYALYPVAGDQSEAGHANAGGKLARFTTPGALLVDYQGNLLVADTGNHRIRKVALIDQSNAVSDLAGGPLGSADGAALNGAQFNAPNGLALDPAGHLLVADTGNHRIRRIADGVVTTLAGSSEGFADGTGTEARFNRPRGLAVDAQGNLYVADSYNNRIRKVTPQGVVTTVAGAAPSGKLDGPGLDARFFRPSDVAVGPGGVLYVADTGNNLVRKLTPRP
ncbi:MAG: SMP-30/gluconolactonase/LRE family protein [Candidatus Sericytochromatia bacterium]|nr:SMP-30/gluconolactonase/LRE family protein [Candidatus Sericytochromatia bacterium]